MLSVLHRIAGAVGDGTARLKAPSALHPPEAVPIAMAAVVAAGLGAVGLRWWASRRALRQRVAYAVLPADEFDPLPEEIERVAAQLGRTRRAVLGFFDRPATAVRVELASAQEGRLAFLLEGPARSDSMLRTARYDGVEIRPAVDLGPLGDARRHRQAAAGDQTPATEKAPASEKGSGEDSPKRPSQRYCSRAELVLALPDERPLRDVPLRPDPHSAFAHAFEQLRDELGDSASVMIDLMPVTPAARRQWARKVIAAERRSGPNGRGGAWNDFLSGMGHGGANGRGGGAVGDFVAGMGHGNLRRSANARPATALRPEAGSVEAYERREERKAISHKLVGHHTAFAFQILIRASSEIKGRPERIVQDLIEAFSVWSGENYLRVAGRRLGPWFVGADAPWRRLEFDRRFDTGRFGPRRRRLVSAREILGLLKPPTVHCRPLNVLRSGGMVPPPPRGLPLFHFQPGVLPLGVVRTPDGDRPVGVYLADTFFAYMSGRARYGKSETGINQFIHLARSGEGCFFLDPHADAIGRIKPYLTKVADRIVEINLASEGGHRQAAWNLFSMEGLGPDDLEAKQSAIVTSFSSAMQWNTGSNTRALNLTTMASKTLLELALVLPPEIAPTIFQMATLLSNDDWREAVLPHVSAHCRDFWRLRFPKQTGGGEAITPVTNILDMLRSSPSVAALLGASRSTLNIRRCMDQGSIVLACPAGADDKDRLVANFLVYEVLRAALSRKDTPPDRRRPFYAWLDEVQTYDGASAGNLARLLEQVGKYGVKAFLLNQNPRRLTEATREAVFMNSSHVATATLDAEAATTVANQWGKAVSATTIERLERFTYLTSVTLGRQVTRPFLVRGFEVTELWAEHYNPDGVAEMERVIDEAQGRRPVAETLAALDGLDEAIAAHLESLGKGSRLQLVPPGPEGAGGRQRADHVRWDNQV